MQINILAVGDVCGDPGLEFLEKNLKQLQKEREIAFTVVNGENANVVGITPRQADAILRAGADAALSVPGEALPSTAVISAMCAC